MSMVKVKSIAAAVTTAGTQVALAAAGTMARSCSIQANSSNTGNIFVGGDDVNSTNGVVLEPGQAIELEPPTDAGGMHMDMDLGEIYIDSAVNGEAVRVIYFYKN
jgi:hypothetical protein